MHRIFSKLNHRNIELLTPNNANAVVGIRLADGSFTYRKWLGLITCSHAKYTGRPVKLAISRIDDRRLQLGELVQGCLTDEGVYGVVDSTVSIIKIAD